MVEKNRYLKPIIYTLVAVILLVGGFFIYKSLNRDTSGDNGNKKEEKKELKSNITPLLYEVTKEGSTNKMYLFGSVHIANKEDLVFPEYVMNAYNNSHYLACEFDDIAFNSNQEKAIESAMKMLYQDGATIKDHLSEKTYNKLIKFLTNKNEYINVYEQYKLYFFISLISNIMAKDAKINASTGVDNYFIRKAHDDKKTILEVESYDYQIGLLEGFPDEFYDLLIEDEIDNYDKSVIELQNLYKAWKSGNAQDLLKYGSDDMQIEESYTEEQKKYVNDFNKKLIEERNKEMLNKAIDYFNNNQDVFYMVGSYHIVGDTALAKQLEQNGFSVKQISN